MIGHYEDSLLANFTNADPAFADAQLRFKVKTKGTKVVNIMDFKGWKFEHSNFKKPGENPT